MTLLFYEDPMELRALGYADGDRKRHLRMLPAPLESGVRLRDLDVDGNESGELPAAPSLGKQDVA